MKVVKAVDGNNKKEKVVKRNKKGSKNKKKNNNNDESESAGDDGYESGDVADLTFHDTENPPSTPNTTTANNSGAPSSAPSPTKTKFKRTAMVASMLGNSKKKGKGDNLLVSQLTFLKDEPTEEEKAKEKRRKKLAKYGYGVTSDDSPSATDVDQQTDGSPSSPSSSPSTTKQKNASSSSSSPPVAPLSPGKLSSKQQRADHGDHQMSASTGVAIEREETEEEKQRRKNLMSMENFLVARKAVNADGEEETEELDENGNPLVVKKKKKKIIKRRKKTVNGGGAAVVELDENGNPIDPDASSGCCNSCITGCETCCDSSCSILTSAMKSLIETLKELSGADLEQDLDPEPTFFVFQRGGWVRETCITINSHWTFEILVYAVTLETCIALGFETPELSINPSTSLQTFLDVNLYLAPVFFGIESFIRMTAKGVFYYRTAYLRSAWNCVDFLVFVTSVVTIFVVEFKIVRSFRIFRLASKIDSVKVVIETMVSILPTMSNVVLLLLFVFIVFAVLGVQLFKGSFVTCTDPSVTTRTNCTGEYTIYTPTILTDIADNYTTSYFIDRKVKPRLWQHSFWNFNNVGNALLTLFLLMFSEAWSTVLYNGMDGQSFDFAMARNASPVAALYFVIFMIVGNFFLYNLFVGSLMAAFGEEREKRSGILDESGARLLTEAQQQWVRTYQIAQASDLQPRVQPAKNSFRQFFCWIYFNDRACTSPRAWFEWVITGSIIINVIFLATVHSDQPNWWEDGLYVINLLFAVVFCIEAIVKIMALMPQIYFADNWNRFDFILVPTAFISVFVGGPGTSAIRVLRVARVLRLVKRAKGLQRLFNSLVHAAPQLFNVTVLLLLVLFVFGVIGTSLFGELYSTDADPEWIITSYFNFKNAGNAMILLFQIATTEAWPNVLEAAASSPETSDCSYALNNCGTPAAYPFFIIFMLLVNCVALNLFVYVIIDQYMQMNSAGAAQTTVLFERLNHFRELWEFLDTKVTQFIPWENFVLVMHRVFSIITTTADALEYSDIARIMQEEEEISKRLGAKSDLKLFRKFRAMDVPVDSKGRVNYRECILGISREHFGLNDEETAMAAALLSLPVPLDPVRTKHIVKIHHLLAVRTMQRRFRANRQKRREREALLTKDVMKKMGGSFPSSVAENSKNQEQQQNDESNNNTMNTGSIVRNRSMTVVVRDPSEERLDEERNQKLQHQKTEQQDKIHHTPTRPSEDFFDTGSPDTNLLYTSKRAPRATLVSNLQKVSSTSTTKTTSPPPHRGRGLEMVVDEQQQNRRGEQGEDDSVSPKAFVRNPFTPPKSSSSYYYDDEDFSDPRRVVVNAPPPKSVAQNAWNRQVSPPQSISNHHNSHHQNQNHSASASPTTVLPGAFVREFRSPNSFIVGSPINNNVVMMNTNSNNNNNQNYSRVVAVSPHQSQQATMPQQKSPPQATSTSATTSPARVMNEYERMRPRSWGKM